MYSLIQTPALFGAFLPAQSKPRPPQTESDPHQSFFLPLLPLSLSMPDASSSTFLLLPLLFSTHPPSLPHPPLNIHFFSFSIPKSSLYLSFHCLTTVILRLISPPRVRLLDPLCLPASCPVIASVGGLTSSCVRHWNRQKVRIEKKGKTESKGGGLFRIMIEGNLGETDSRKGRQRRDDSLAIMRKQRKGGIFW